VLTISAITPGTGVTGGSVNNFFLNANTTLAGNVAITNGKNFDGTGITNGTPSSNLTVNGSINAFQSGTGGVRTAYFTNNPNFAAGRTLAIFNDQANGPQINFDDNTSAPPQGGSLSFVRGVSLGNFLMNIPLTVQGNVTASDVIATTSDLRSKHDIVTIDSALDKVMKLRGVYYSRNEDNVRRAGVIAQEVEEVLPEVVFTDSNGMKSVAYGNIIGLLIEAVKEQQEMIKKLM
jgi:hypothetical protein